MTDLSVLLLEDRPDDAERLVATLEEAGFEVRADRVTSLDAFETALRPDLDVVLAEHSLLELSLPTALRALKASGLTVPLIVVADNLPEEMVVQVLRAGAADVLVKDRLGRLPQAIEAAVERRMLRDQRDEDERVLRGALAELSAANEELRRVDAFKDQVIAMTSHELRTPLTSILGYTSLLLEAWDDEYRESGRRWAETVDRQTRRLIRLVEDLLTLSRLEGGRLELDLEPVAVESIVAATVEGLPQRARVNTLREMRRVLKKDGLLVIEDAAQHSDMPDLRVFLENFGRDMNEPFFLDYLNETLEPELERAGFRVESVTSAFLSKVVVARAV